MLVSNPDLPDMAMVRWVAFIRTFTPTIRVVPGKENVVPDGLSRQPNHSDEGSENSEEFEEFVDRQLNVIGIVKERRELLEYLFLRPSMEVNS